MKKPDAFKDVIMMNKSCSLHIDIFEMGFLEVSSSGDASSVHQTQEYANPKQASRHQV